MSLAADSFPALGTTALVVVAEASASTRLGRSCVGRELVAIDLACSRFRPDSELSAVNRGAGSDVEVSPLCFEAVSVALDVAALTGGLVDPTVGANLRLAGYDRTLAELRLRDGRRVRASFPTVAGWETVRDPVRGTIRVPAGVELDLGASAKALAADRAASTASNATGSGVLVSLGGDVAVAGVPQTAAGRSGSPTTTLRRSTSPAPSSRSQRAGSPVPAPVCVAGQPRAVRSITSSTRAGRSATTPWKTVSVASSSCVLANAASTAAIVLGSDAQAWLEGRGVPARLSAADGTVATVNGWPADCP